MKAVGGSYPIEAKRRKRSVVLRRKYLLLELLEEEAVDDAVVLVGVGCSSGLPSSSGGPCRCFLCPFLQKKILDSY